MARYRVTISSSDKDAMLDLVREHGVTVIDHGLRVRPGEPFHVDAIVDEADIAKLESHGYAVERHEDVDHAGRERQREIGRGNRYFKGPARDEE